MPEPITLAIAIAGLFIVGFALAGVKLIESSARWLGLAFLVFILALLAGRVAPNLLSGDFQQNTGAFLNEALDRVTTAPARAGWNQLPNRIDPAYLVETGFLPIQPADAQIPPSTQPATQPVPSTNFSDSAITPPDRVVTPPTQTTVPTGSTSGRSPVTGLW